jgi:hypothetical protein
MHKDLWEMPNPASGEDVLKTCRRCKTRTARGGNEMFIYSLTGPLPNPASGEDALMAITILYRF